MENKAERGKSAQFTIILSPSYIGFG